MRNEADKLGGETGDDGMINGNGNEEGDDGRMGDETGDVGRTEEN